MHDFTVVHACSEWQHTLLHFSDFNSGNTKNSHGTRVCLNFLQTALQSKVQDFACIHMLLKDTVLYSCNLKYFHFILNQVFVFFGVTGLPEQTQALVGTPWAGHHSVTGPHSHTPSGNVE